MTCSHVLTVIVLTWLLGASCSGAAGGFESLDRIKTTVPSSEQEAAVRALIGRLVPGRAVSFQVVVNPSLGPPHLDTFQVESSGQTIKVSGTSGVAVAWGFQHYIKHFCGAHVSWAGDQLNLPAVLPPVRPALRVTSPNRFRYYQNVCTVSYSFAWWNWTRWEREIDWMALNGINLPLAFTGQEAIWQRVYLSLGLSQADLDAHFGGPAFLAWARMGNMQGWGGPLPASWHADQLALQHRILARMRSLGMTPVLPAFAGHIPDATARLFPEATIINGTDWSHFNKDPEYCCPKFLVPSDPLFKKIGIAFIKEMWKEFNGTDHVYSADLFNEMNPVSNDLEYLANASRGLFETVNAADPRGIWLMQGWLFNQEGFWFKEQMEAHLTAVPLGRMIVLDLAADTAPIYERTNSFYGQPFIWCMLHNFGGNHGLYGRLDFINKAVFVSRAFPGSSMVGTGLTPEGINQNDVVYAFMNDLALMAQPANITAWMDSYVARRYGEFSAEATAAWQLLKDTIYNSMSNAGFHNHNALVQRPSISITPFVWYDWTEVARAWPLMLSASAKLGASPLFRYDLVDIGRQVLQDITMTYYEGFQNAYHKKNQTEAMSYLTKFLDVLLDMDALLATDAHWLLGNWLEDAKALGSTIKDKKWLQFNAKAQITIWGPHAEINDYANKEWAGLVKSYYHSRWSLFSFEMELHLRLGRSWNQTWFNQLCFESIEQPWVYDTADFSTVPIGDTLEVSRTLYKKYKTVIKSRRKNVVNLPANGWQSAPKYPPST